MGLLLCWAAAAHTWADTQDARSARPHNHHQRRTLLLLVFPTTVDPKRHAERRATIRETWGARRSRSQTGWRVRTFFVEAGSAASRDILVPPVGVGSAEAFVWAARRALQQEASNLTKPPSSTWLFRAETITYVRVEVLLQFLETQGDRAATTPLLFGKQLRTARVPNGNPFLSGGAGFALNMPAFAALHAKWASVARPFLRSSAWHNTAAPDGEQLP